MKGLKWFVLGLALAVLVAAPVVAAEKAAGGKDKAGKGEALRGEFAIMVSELKLTEQQQADLKAKVQAKQEAAAAWEKANGEKLKAAEEAAKKAKESGDKAAVKKAAEDLHALEADREKATADAEAAIVAILTPEQKTAWAGFKMYRGLMIRYKKVNPTDDQAAKIKAACTDAAKELGDSPDAKAKAEAVKKLHKTVEETILTADQRAQLEKKPAVDKAVDKGKDIAPENK